LSGLIVLGYVVFAYREFGGPVEAIKVLACCLIPLACIWFSEPMGDYTGYAGGGRFISRQSPAAFVAFFGWVVLLLPILIIPIMYLMEL
jgi:hypothetical protein